MSYNFSKQPSFKETEFKEPIFEFVLSLGSFKNEKFISGGACVLIGNNLAITAKHVVMADIKIFEEEIPESNLTGTYFMQAVQVIKNGETANIWNVKKIFCSGSTDIAFLFLEPYKVAKDYKARSVKIQLALPQVGERLVAFGYAKTKIQSDNKKISWEYNAMTSVGEVKSIEQGGFGLAKFPCFTTNAPWENHMSGGAIFNEEGKLCGLISASIWSGNEHIQSTGVLLWPAMEVELDVDRFGFEKGLKYPALDLCRDGFINAENWERIEIILSENKRQIKYKNK